MKTLILADSTMFSGFIQDKKYISDHILDQIGLQVELENLALFVVKN